MTRVFGSIGVFAATFAAAAAQNPAIVYKFDAAHAAGIEGSINVNYADQASSIATITASLDFSAVDQTKVAAFDGNCTDAVTSYKWHIHTGWNSTLSSDSFKQCSKAATGNHYDPLKACGPASEYVTESECKAKSLAYGCNSTSYKSDPSVCEKGDLSGKFGAFKLGADAKVSVKWIDEHYPLQVENKATWSIVLHAVCGKEAPRIACALGHEMDKEDDTTEQDAEEREPKEQCKTVGV